MKRRRGGGNFPLSAVILVLLLLMSIKGQKTKETRANTRVILVDQPNHKVGIVGFQSRDQRPYPFKETKGGILHESRGLTMHRLK